MKPDTRENPQLSTEERRFVETLSAAYQPEPLTGFRRAALDARLREQLDAPRRLPSVLPAALAASVVAALIWVGIDTREPASLQQVHAGDTTSEHVVAWEEQLLFANLGELTFGDDDNDEATLPPEYAAIESAFF